MKPDCPDCGAIVRDNVRKNDERNPCHMRGSGDKWIQRNMLRMFWRRFMVCVCPVESQTFLQNESTVELVDVKDSLWEVLQVNIIHGVNFGNERQFELQLQETRRFLEKCRDTVSLSCELTDFLENVAQSRGETLAVARKQISKAAHKIAQLFEYREQSSTMGLQFEAYLRKVCASKGVTEEAETSSMVMLCDNLSNQGQGTCDFEGNLLFSYAEVILQRWAEGNEVLADVAEQYWDYLPVEVQEYLCDDISRHLQVRDGHLQDGYSDSNFEVLNVYIASVSRAENSISRAKALNESMPKVRLTELDKRCLEHQEKSSVQEKEIESTTPSSKGYTLEELLEGVSPENSHEAADWGEPIGNEVW